MHSGVYFLLLFSLVVFSPNFAMGAVKVPLCRDEILNTLDEHQLPFLCRDSWDMIRDRLHPTQADIGVAAVLHKVGKLASKIKAHRHYVDDGILTCVLGGNKWTLYLVDGHHKAAALDYIHSNNITLNILIVHVLRQSETSSLEWSRIIQQNFSSIVSFNPRNYSELPMPITYFDIPKVINFNKKNTTFVNNPWRSIVYFAQHQDRCFAKQCRNIPFRQPMYYQEFVWSYFLQHVAFNYACDEKCKYHANISHLQMLTLNFGIPNEIRDVNDDLIRTYELAASIAVQLCRSHIARSFSPPQDIFPFFKHLPGLFFETESYPDEECFLPITDYAKNNYRAIRKENGQYF
jgi:hypothetical protein